MRGFGARHKVGAEHRGVNGLGSFPDLFSHSLNFCLPMLMLFTYVDVVCVSEKHPFCLHFVSSPINRFLGFIVSHYQLACFFNLKSTSLLTAVFKKETILIGLKSYHNLNQKDKKS